MPGIDKMKLFCSESVSEGDKLTIRAYKNNFCVKLSPFHFFNRVDINSNLFRLPSPVALRKNACYAIV